ncbi:hypothetical protein EVAR_21335_1 [Eumeta japonica]|uniref:Uncharacterized protein n=1 Tax=Eumeta variegata TaxID=151549 RepID=A0A4C1ZUF8_EUMVA|nr:hypothetical protein EVAR_21335_1 [Eumeta japonica]
MESAYHRPFVANVNRRPSSPAQGRLKLFQFRGTRAIYNASPAPCAKTSKPVFYPMKNRRASRDARRPVKRRRAAFGCGSRGPRPSGVNRRCNHIMLFSLTRATSRRILKDARARPASIPTARAACSPGAAVYHRTGLRCGWESLMKNVTLGNVTMSHRTRGPPNALRLSPLNYDRSAARAALEISA